ncbi:MAG: alpha/beta hydrolase-fold protein [Byssovorax sp.]
MKRLPLLLLSLGLASLLAACGPDDLGSSSTTGGAGGTSSTSTTTGAGGTGTTTSTTSGTGGGPTIPDLDTILAELRADTDGTLAKYAALAGWPVPVSGGYLFVSTDPKLTFAAGDHDGWAGTAMKADQGFSWVVIAAPMNDHYKFTDKTTYASDPWSRSYNYDEFGEISLALPVGAHLDRFFGVGDAKLEPRTVRVWVPAEPVTHELYVHDGQNLFDPQGIWGGWHLQDTVPPGMLLVGIDNTPARMDEYTHVPDKIDGQLMGGLGDAYADFLEVTVRPLIRAAYGEPGPVGVMGSSLGGLISFHVADHEPGKYAFAASLSGTMGWGSIGAGVHNPTMIERYKAHGHQGTVLYLDSGGSGNGCADSDGDGVDDDDPDAADNYCENTQLRDTLASVGYVKDQDLFYVWDPGAMHNEAAWAARVAVPMQIFNGL